MPGLTIPLVRVVDRLNLGGAAYHVLFLAGLDRLGYRTDLLKGSVGRGEAEITDPALLGGQQVHEVRGLGREVSPLQDLAAFVRVYLQIRRLRPVVVHTHKSKAGVLGRLAARAAGVPVVVHTFHGNVFQGYFSPWKNRLIVMVERLLAGLTHAVVTISRQQRRELLHFRIARSSRLHVIPPGLNLAPFVARRRSDDGVRAELGFRPDAPLVGLSGRLVPIKGVHYFIEAAQQISSSLPHVRFVVVGDGELRPELEKLATTLGLGDRLRFVGFRHDIPRLYGALDLLVLSSVNEGLPWAVIEAIASGCYVVATRVGGVPLLIRSEATGLVVSPGDSQALAKAAVVALEEGRRISERERARISGPFGIDRLNADLDRLYRSLLAKNAGGRAAEPIVVAGEGMLE